MEQDSETINSGNIVDEHRNPDGTFKVGHPKLGGKKLGTRNFMTDFEEVIADIAKEKGISVSDARKQVLKSGFKYTLEGSATHYKDIADRVYGKVPENLNVQANVDVNIITPEQQAKWDALLNQ